MKTWSIGILLAAATLAGCDEEVAKEVVVTVDDVLSDPSAYLGETIRVRGDSWPVRSGTAIGCDPHTCSCNGNWGTIGLRTDGREISVPEFDGEGNECYLLWPLTHPEHKGFELVGRLIEMDPGSGWFSLVDLDLNESRVLVGDGPVQDREAVSFTWEPYICGCDRDLHADCSDTSCRPENWSGSAKVDIV
ncbi:MAG: hypothetical protein AAGA56_03350 [Myxococcota bacterium]